MSHKPKIIYLVVIFACVIFFIDFFSSDAISNAAGAAPAKTGSPADISNCSDCHASFPQTISGIIKSNIPASGYIPGSIYTITVSIANPAFASYAKMGFQVSPQDSSGAILGNMIITDAFKTQLVGSGGYITHTFTGTTPDSAGYKTWNFNWQAPVAGTGDVVFYGSFLLANGNGINTGDQGLLSALKVIENTASGIGKNTPDELNFSITPNPASEIIGVFLHKTNDFIEEVQIFDLNGKVLLKQKNEYLSPKQTLNVCSLSKGIYFISVFTKNKNFTQKFIKN